MKIAIYTKVKEIEIAVDEKELQKEAALKEKEKELHQLREQIEELTNVSSQSEKKQNGLVLELRSKLQQASAERESKYSISNAWTIKDLLLAR